MDKSFKKYVVLSFYPNDSLASPDNRFFFVNKLNQEDEISLRKSKRTLLIAITIIVKYRARRHYN